MDSSSGTMVDGNNESRDQPDFYQHVVVMRHGDRMDMFEPSWVTTAARPWDPPLVYQGRVRAFRTGRKLRNTLVFPIHRVFVSPFLRCIETAKEVVSALSAVNDDPAVETGDGIVIDPSQVKVSVEYGLCEVMSSAAIHPELIPKDGNWGFDLSEREVMFPAGTVDNNVERVYKELPKWEEPVADTKARYHQIFKDLADKYPMENLLLVTHGEGVGVALTSFLTGATVYEVRYCGHVELRRPIFRKDQWVLPGAFEVVTQTDINFILPGAPKNEVSQSS
ncbi:hypothetical protein L6164_003585 [Bauhinia variegata]|uniref:Uncharacterized protein n=1 Tax=Bauhinia variegata TaxID=167791 RepID=A0ACB9Q1R0_BAUVA|nr:hypothetical protein L6164_003585 [Bauhinia variegata]